VSGRVGDEETHCRGQDWVKDGTVGVTGAGAPCTCSPALLRETRPLFVPALPCDRKAAREIADAMMPLPAADVVLQALGTRKTPQQLLTDRAVSLDVELDVGPLTNVPPSLAFGPKSVGLLTQRRLSADSQQPMVVHRQEALAKSPRVALVGPCNRAPRRVRLLRITRWRRELPRMSWHLSSGHPLVVARIDSDTPSAPPRDSTWGQSSIRMSARNGI
jgi:hypothetical protein